MFELKYEQFFKVSDETWPRPLKLDGSIFQKFFFSKIG